MSLKGDINMVYYSTIGNSDNTFTVTINEVGAGQSVSVTVSVIAISLFYLIEGNVLIFAIMLST